MTDFAALPDSHQDPTTTTALQHVEAAGDELAAAKRTRSAELIAQAEWELHAAVDVARDQQIQWGQIGSALDIARGNAYKRYRKRLSFNDFHDGSGTTGAYPYPSL